MIKGILKSWIQTERVRYRAGLRNSLLLSRRYIAKEKRIQIYVKDLYGDIKICPMSIL